MTVLLSDQLSLGDASQRSVGRLGEAQSSDVLAELALRPQPQGGRELTDTIDELCRTLDELCRTLGEARAA